MAHFHISNQFSLPLMASTIIILIISNAAAAAAIAVPNHKGMANVRITDKFVTFAKNYAGTSKEDVKDVQKKFIFCNSGEFVQQILKHFSVPLIASLFIITLIVSTTIVQRGNPNVPEDAGEVRLIEDVGEAEKLAEDERLTEDVGEAERLTEDIGEAGRLTEAFIRYTESYGKKEVKYFEKNISNFCRERRAMHRVGLHELEEKFGEYALPILNYKPKVYKPREYFSMEEKVTEKDFERKKSEKNAETKKGEKRVEIKQEKAEEKQDSKYCFSRCKGRYGAFAILDRDSQQKKSENQRLLENILKEKKLGAQTQNKKLLEKILRDMVKDEEHGKKKGGNDSGTKDNKEHGKKKGVENASEMKDNKERKSRVDSGQNIYCYGIENLPVFHKTFKATSIKVMDVNCQTTIRVNREFNRDKNKHKDDKNKQKDEEEEKKWRAKMNWVLEVLRWVPRDIMKTYYDSPIYDMPRQNTWRWQEYELPPSDQTRRIYIISCDGALNPISAASSFIIRSGSGIPIQAAAFTGLASLPIEAHEASAILHGLKDMIKYLGDQEATVQIESDCRAVILAIRKENSAVTHNMSLPAVKKIVYEIQVLADTYFPNRHKFHHISRWKNLAADYLAGIAVRSGGRMLQFNDIPSQIFKPKKKLPPSYRIPYEKQYQLDVYEKHKISHTCVGSRFPTILYQLCLADRRGERRVLLGKGQQWRRPSEWEEN